MSSFLHDLEWVLPLRNDFLTAVFEFFTMLGYAVFFFFALPILFWAWRKEGGNRVAVLLLFSALVNYFLKDFFQDPRPDESLRVEGHAPTSFGLPSGHTQLAIVFWGGIAMEIGRRRAWIAAVIFIVGIAFSRLYLGVHDVEDVLGGMLLGFSGLACLYTFKRIPIPEKSLKFGLPLVMIIPFFLWPHTGIAPGKVLAVTAFALGWVFGYDTECRVIRSSSVRSLKQRALAVVVGILVMALVLGGLRFLFQAVGFSETFSLFTGGLIAGFLVTCFLPALFVKMGIFDREQTQTSLSTEPLDPPKNSSS